MLFCLLLAPAAMAQDAMPHRTLKPNLTILMDEDLILPTAALARNYAKSTHTPLTTVVRNPDTENEIGQGLEAHLILSADNALIERLAAQGLTDVSSIHVFAQSSDDIGKSYFVAVLASESMDDARSFVSFLDSKPAQELLKKTGLKATEK